VPMSLPVSEIGLDPAVLTFAGVASIIAGLVCGLAPLVPIMRSDIGANLKEGSRGSTSGGHNRLRAVLVGCEIGVSVVLLVGAGLLLHSFWNINHVDPGFNPQNVLTASIWLPIPNDPTQFRYGKHETRVILIREILRRARTLPGVESVALGAANTVPLLTRNSLPIRPEGFAGSDSELPLAEVANVSPDFFQVLGVPLRRGRIFTEADDGRDGLAVVDETLAHRVWPNQDPIGKRIAVGAVPGKYGMVIGVVGNMKTDAFEAPDAPHLYFSIYRRSSVALSVVLRSASNPQNLGEALRREIQAVDPDLPIYSIRTMEDIISSSLAQRRFQLQMIGAFAVVALLLAGMGIYGVTAFWVGQRTPEIGIRIALGAHAMDVIGMVLRQGVKLTAWGVLAGLAVALPLTRVLRSLLFGTTPNDPLTFAAVALVVAGVALLACYIPALRATRVDPAIALHAE
jgi:predicted permease